MFRVPFGEMGQPAKLLERGRASGLRLFGLAAGAAITIENANLTDACALVVGNEGAGLSTEFVEAAEMISIPTAGVESLNASVAASIALFEAARQRGRNVRRGGTV